MKKFKQLLEFIDNFDKNRKDENPGRAIREFMMKTPFSINLYSTESDKDSGTSGHGLHFRDMYDAAKLVSHNLAKHERGFIESNRKKDTRMGEYFLKSTTTHENLIDAIQTDLYTNPKLPKYLRKHVASVIEEIHKEGEQALRTADLLGGDNTQYTVDKHKTSNPASERHSHLEDESHHLQGVIRRVQEDPDRGYFIRHEEIE